MKVYLVTNEPFPNGMAATNRIKCYARAINEGGISCEVIIAGSTEIKGSIQRNVNKFGIYENVYYNYIGGSPIGSSNKNNSFRMLNIYFINKN